MVENLPLFNELEKIRKVRVPTDANRACLSCQCPRDPLARFTAPRSVQVLARIAAHAVTHSCMREVDIVSEIGMAGRTNLQARQRAWPARTIALLFRPPV